MTIISFQSSTSVTYLRVREGAMEGGIGLKNKKS